MRGGLGRLRVEILSALFDTGVVPVVRADSPDNAVRISEALLEGGMSSIEITFTVPGATGVIKALRKEHPNLLVGAGTILDEATARAAVDAGAHYLVSVGIVPGMIETAHRYGLPAFPGVYTPTEAVHALELGADVLKLFPASSGGPAHLAALRAPLPQAYWCPTGGISLDNVADWVRAGANLVGIGSPLLQDAVQTGDMNSLTVRARQWVEVWARIKETAE